MKILTNTLAISGEILDIINHSKNYLYLMSPYVQLEKDDSSSFFIEKISDALKNATRKHVRIRFVSRASDDNTESQAEKVLKQYIERGCELFLIPNLHSKIYCNESKVLITSMNMYLHSVLNNAEIGVLLNSENDVEDIREYIETLITDNQKISKADVKEKPWKDQYEAKGFCIVCNNEIEFDPELEQIICEDCLKGNIQYYKGEYCHFCGKKGKKYNSSMPACKNCWYQYQNIRQFETWSSNNP